MVEPPERRAGDEEISGPGSLQRLQVADRVGAPGRMVAGIASQRVLREVPGVPVPSISSKSGSPLLMTSTLAPVGMTFRTTCLIPAIEPLVGGTRTTPMGLPLDAPFALESFAVGLQQLLELSGCQQTAQRHAPEVVDEDIFRAHQAIPFRPETHRIIVILEHGDVVLLVERTDSLVGPAPHREAEHGEHRDFETHSRTAAVYSRANRSNSA